MNKKYLLLVLPALVFVGCSEKGNTSSVPTQTAVNKMASAAEGMNNVDAFSVSMKDARIKASVTGMSYDDDGNPAGEATLSADLSKINFFAGFKGIQAVASDTPDFSKFEAVANASVEGKINIGEETSLKEEVSAYVKDAYVYADVSGSPLIKSLLGVEEDKFGASIADLIGDSGTETDPLEISEDIDVSDVSLADLYAALVQTVGEGAVSEIVKCTENKGVYKITVDVNYDSVNAAVSKYISYQASQTPGVTSDQISAAVTAMKQALSSIGFDAKDYLKLSVSFTEKYFVNISLDANLTLDHLDTLELPITSVVFEAKLGLDFKYGKDVVLDMPSSFEDYTIVQPGE